MRSVHALAGGLEEAQVLRRNNAARMGTMWGTVDWHRSATLLQAVSPHAAEHSRFGIAVHSMQLGQPLRTALLFFSLASMPIPLAVATP